MSRKMNELSSGCSRIEGLENDASHNVAAFWTSQRGWLFPVVADAIPALETLVNDTGHGLERWYPNRLADALG